jgi:hypothetical protein
MSSCEPCELDQCLEATSPIFEVRAAKEPVAEPEGVDPARDCRVSEGKCGATI